MPAEKTEELLAMMQKEYGIAINKEQKIVASRWLFILSSYTDVYSLLVNSQHVWALLCPSPGEQDCIKLRVVLAWLCWLWSCGAGKKAMSTV